MAHKKPRGGLDHLGFGQSDSRARGTNKGQERESAAHRDLHHGLTGTFALLQAAHTNRRGRRLLAFKIVPPAAAASPTPCQLV